LIYSHWSCRRNRGRLTGNLTSTIVIFVSTVGGGEERGEKRREREMWNVRERRKRGALTLDYLG
jgi:hypothetical protein